MPSLRANIMNSVCWTLSNHQALCQPLYTHYLSILTKSHEVISVWLEGKGSNRSDKLLQVTWLVDGRCWLCTRDGPAPSPYSFLSGMLLPREWKQGDGTCTWGSDLPRLSSSNPSNYTDLARLVFFLFCSGSKNFTQLFQSWLQLGSQAGNGSRYVWFEHWGRLSSCYHLQRPTGELRVMETPERGGWGQAGQSYSCRLTGAILEAWVDGPHSHTYVYTPTW